MSEKAIDKAIGMVGLGVMGLNLAQNLADHGHGVAVYARRPEAVAEAVAVRPSIRMSLVASGVPVPPAQAVEACRRDLCRTTTFVTQVACGRCQRGEGRGRACAWRTLAARRTSCGIPASAATCGTARYRSSRCSRPALGSRASHAPGASCTARSFLDLCMVTSPHFTERDSSLGLATGTRLRWTGRPPAARGARRRAGDRTDRSCLSSWSSCLVPSRR